MKLSMIKLAGLLAASMAVAGTGPAWGAATDTTQAAKAKPVVKAKKAPAKTVKAKTVKAKAATKSAKSKQAPVAVNLAAVPGVAATASVAPLAAIAPPAAAEPTPAAKLAEVTVATAPDYTGNPYLAYRQQASSPTAAIKPTESTAAPAPVASGNPYLGMAYSQQASPAAKPAEVAAAPAPAVSANPYLDLAYRQPASMVAAAPLNIKNDAAGLLDGIKSLLPSIPDGKTFLPSIKTVYPTGEKPLVVLSFNCPTEMVGITPIPTKLLKEGLEGVFGMINATDLLSFDLMQVCQ